MSPSVERELLRHTAALRRLARSWSALRGKLLRTRPQSPLNLSAGILGLDAFQPSDADARVSIRVLAARRSQ